jgi:Subtilase family
MSEKKRNGLNPPPAAHSRKTEMPLPGQRAQGAGATQTEIASQMPVPATRSTPVSSAGMPLPGQQRSGHARRMPVPAMTTGMPAGHGGTATAQAQMRPPGMHDGGAALPRFRPSNSPPGTPVPAVFEPGIIEVQFREGLRPEVTSAGSGAPTEVRSQAGIALTELNRILHRYHVAKAEPTFSTTHEEATAAQSTARLQGINAPHLAHFVTFHFPATSDVNLIARELSQLSEVEVAVPVPRAIPPGITTPLAPYTERTEQTSGITAVAAPVALPPASPLADPLVGNSDQVVVDPVTGLEHQWYIFRCHADEAWSRASADGVVIADVDWGCRTSHQDLAADIERTYNAFDGGGDITQGGSVFHGTGVLGLAGAAANGLGNTGFGYGARLWPIQADSGPGPGLGGNAWARGIDWVRTTDSGGRRKVVILEVQTGAFGNYEQVPSVNAAIQTAIGAGVVVCVAAGNGDRG